MQDGDLFLIRVMIGAVEVGDVTQRAGLAGTYLARRTGGVASIETLEGGTLANNSANLASLTVNVSSGNVRVGTHSAVDAHRYVAVVEVQQLAA